MQDKKILKALNTELTSLKEKLAHARKLEGKDTYIEVRAKKNQARFERIRQKGMGDTGVGKFYIQIDITAKQENVFVPISIATGKKTAGFMYQIEGTAPGSIATADIKTRGEGVSQVTVGTLLYAKIPTGKTASFEVRATVRGKIGKVYKMVFTRLNYKLQLTEVRYHQYLKEIPTESAIFS